MYFEFLLRRAHSRSRVDRGYWSGDSLYSRTTCSNSVMVGVIGPIGSGFPQLGFPRRLAMYYCLSTQGDETSYCSCPKLVLNRIPKRVLAIHEPLHIFPG